MPGPETTPDPTIASHQRIGLVAVQAPEVDGHEKRRHLIVRDPVLQIGLQESLQLLGPELAPSRLVSITLDGIIDPFPRPRDILPST